MLKYSNEIKSFLMLPYEELETRNLEMKSLRKQLKGHDFFKERILKYLTDEKNIKAVTVCFTDLEGKLQSLDYDKQYLVKKSDNLTFDGSSVRGFSSQHESDLLLQIDWSSFYWAPCDIFGPGKVIVFANVHDRNKSQYNSDFRGMLQNFLSDIFETKKMLFNMAPEIEGFLLQGIDAEQNFCNKAGFQFVTTGGYYNSLPQDPLRLFIDIVAEAKRAMGFRNEKDHPEVAPSQFELNYQYTNPVEACDQIQLYKLLCKQVAKKMGYTASFLPKPFMNVNGSGMHTNISASVNDENVFYCKKAKDLSDFGKEFSAAILYHAKNMCLILNSSVNAYRRLDPKYEAPSEIKMSTYDRSSMIRVPYGDKSSTRVEVRSVAPDCNPYLSIFVLLKIGMLSQNKKVTDDFSSIFDKREKLPGNIYDAIRYFKNSSVMKDILGKDSHAKYLDLKETVANRCPKDLGNMIKTEEVIYHHEVTNQFLWNRF
ncbi:MAG: glutamine synthetase family protein [Candidatus Rickettsia vulgarisii]